MTRRNPHPRCMAAGIVILVMSAIASADNVTEQTGPVQSPPVPTHAYAGKTAGDVQNPNQDLGSDDADDRKTPKVPGAETVIRMLIWVGVVVVFIYAAVYLIRRYVPSARNMFGGGILKVVGRTYISSKQCILLVKVASKYVMVGVTGTSMTPLAEVADPEDARKISEELIEKSGASITGSFRQALERADGDYTESQPAAATAADNSEISEIRSELEEVTQKMNWWRRRGAE